MQFRPASTRAAMPSASESKLNKDQGLMLTEGWDAMKLERTFLSIINPSVSK